MTFVDDPQPKSDVARETCEKAEEYMDRIRKRELHFTPDADSLKVDDRLKGDNVSLPVYAWRCMSDYDDQKLKEAEYLARTRRSGDFEYNDKMVQIASGTKLIIAQPLMSPQPAPTSLTLAPMKSSS